MKYELKNHLQLEHENCEGVWLHCIRHGLCGCNDAHDHSGESSNCNIVLRSAHALRLWLRNCHNDLRRTFEKCLPEWCVRGSSIPNVVSSISSVGPNVENVDTVLNEDNEEASEPMLAWEQCEDCNKWFTLPQGVTTDDLPDVFVCGLRWWDCSLQKVQTGYKDDWCRKGAKKTNLVTKWLRQLTTRAAESMETSNPEDRNVDLVTETMEGLHAGFELTDSLLPGITKGSIPQENIITSKSMKTMSSGSELANPLLPGITKDRVPQGNIIITEPNDSLMNHTPRLEGANSEQGIV